MPAMTHYPKTEEGKTACGEPISGYMTSTDTKAVNCGRCRNTRAFTIAQREARQQ